MATSSEPIHRLLQLSETLLETAIALDPGARGRIRALQGRSLGITVAGLGIAFSVHAADGALRLRSGAESADVRLRGGPWSLARLALSDGVRPLFAGLVAIEGDTEVAKRNKRVFDTLDIDWEEHLARWLGDFPAHRAVLALGALERWARRSGAVLNEDLGDWLREERELLGDARDARELHDAVEGLRADVDRLSARVARCERRAQ